MTTPYYADESVTLYHGDCLDVLRSLPDASVYSVVTDPPYGISFMGKQWDQPGAQGSQRSGGDREFTAGTVGVDHKTTSERSASMHAGLYDLSPHAMRNFQHWCVEWATECLRVLKPGGHMLAFGGSRTWHRLASAVEDAGFEIRDSIAWLYAQGFPKSKNLDGEWQGWGTALKPGFEPIVVGRKPLSGTVAANVLEHGTGALNIDACRIHTPGSEAIEYTVKRLKPGAELNRTGGNWRPESDSAETFTGATKDGRWPTNVVLDESQATELDRAVGPLRGAGNRKPIARNTSGGYEGGWGTGEFGLHPAMQDGDNVRASRFFPTFRYEAKAPTSERPSVDGVAHPTVKPLALMQWLVRLVTPPGGTVLEPFAGSGTTVEACVIEGFACIAIEREADYLPLITSRLTHVQPTIDFGDVS